MALTGLAHPFNQPSLQALTTQDLWQAGCEPQHSPAERVARASPPRQEEHGGSEARSGEGAKPEMRKIKTERCPGSRLLRGPLPLPFIPPLPSTSGASRTARTKPGRAAPCPAALRLPPPPPSAPSGPAGPGPAGPKRSGRGRSAMGLRAPGLRDAPAAGAGGRGEPPQRPNGAEGRRGAPRSPPVPASPPPSPPPAVPPLPHSPPRSRRGCRPPPPPRITSGRRAVSWRRGTT